MKSKKKRIKILCEQKEDLKPSKFRRVSYGTSIISYTFRQTVIKKLDRKRKRMMEDCLDIYTAKLDGLKTIKKRIVDLIDEKLLNEELDEYGNNIESIISPK
eukprot:jgi/Orpsp1_1/1191875/evm.model.d7180000089072.1